MNSESPQKKIEEIFLNSKIPKNEKPICFATDGLSFKL